MFDLKLNDSKLKMLLKSRHFLIGVLLSILVITVFYFTFNDNVTKIIVITLLFGTVLLNKKKKYTPFASGILLVILVISLAYTIYKHYSIISPIQDWDFYAFYLYGKLGISGLNFYDPDNINSIYISLKSAVETDSLFHDQVLKVGFIYPPITMSIFAPLGLFNIETANIFWKILVFLFQVIDVILIIQLFRPKINQSLDIPAIIVIALLFPGVLTTIFYSQTNFFLLFFILLAYKNLENWKSGLFLALAVMIKPLAIVLCLYLIINRRWDSLISLICTGLILIIITGSLFGFNNFISYLKSPPTDRIQEFQYVESINQSLYAHLSRVSTDFGLDNFKSKIPHLTLLLSFFLTALTAIASYRFYRFKNKLSFLIFLPLSLLIYPGFLIHYTIIMIPLFLEILYSEIKPVFTTSFWVMLYLFLIFFQLSNDSCFYFTLIALLSLVMVSLLFTTNSGIGSLGNSELIKLRKAQ